MPRQPTNLAKLTRPKLFRVIARDRLFTRLDQERQSHPVVWIVGPPGSGKTALAASYIETRKLSNIWYQVDGGDADPATFFHYLTIAGQAAAGRKRLRLPAFTPEYALDLPGFTRRYFRELFAGLPTTTTLVLDNYQEVRADSSFHNVIHGAATELPVGINLLVISHVSPPQQYARVVANNLIGQVSWNDLRLTLAETESLASSFSGIDPATLGELHEQANGWAAGIVLMLQRLKESGLVNSISKFGTMTSVFNYFAGQIFDRESIEVREFLMRTAILPRVTVNIGAQLSGNARSEQLLSDFYRRSLFTDRRKGNDVLYQYHGLFRAFLLDRSRVYFSNDDLSALKRRAAEVAAKEGHTNAAIELLAEIGEWKKLTQLICAESSSLLVQGRHQTLLGWIALVPEAEIAKAPWLLYWRGLSRMVFTPSASIIDLEHAYNGFQANTDAAGLFLSCAAVIEAYFFAEDDMTPVLQWGERLQDLMTRFKGFPSTQIEGKVLGSLQGLMYAAPHHPLIRALETSVETFLNSFNDLGGRIAIAYTFTFLALWRGDVHRAQRIIREINAQLKGSSIPPLQLVLWRFMEGNYAWCIGAHEDAVKKFQAALEVTQAFGMPMFNTLLYGMCVYCALSAGDIKQAEAYLNKAEAANHFSRRYILSQLSFLRAGIALMKGDFSAALLHAQTALEETEPLGRPFITAKCRLGLAQVLIEVGDVKTARSHLAQANAYARTMNSNMLELQCLLVEAYGFMKARKGPEALEPLRKGLQIARAHDYVKLNDWWRPQMIASLLSHALEHEIEPLFVRSVIRRRRISAIAGAHETWPWPVKVATLGKFEVSVDEEPVRFHGKAQRKPLELLQCICALGGTAVHQDRVTDALWPDAEGDAAAQALRTTLHRLRKLLQHEQAVRLEDRQLFLEPRYIWVDCLAFERAVAEAGMADRALLERAMNLYHGHFLQGEQASWALPYRERLRAHHMNLAERLGISLEQDGNLTGAVECYLKAFEVEPVAEVFCRKIMIIYGRLGRRTEAVAIYQRFGHSLRSRLGINPTQETQALYHSLSKD